MSNYQFLLVFPQSSSPKSIVYVIQVLSSHHFPSNLESMRGVTVLALISCGAIVLIFLFFLISLIDRFKSKGLNLFIATLLMFNGMLNIRN